MMASRADVWIKESSAKAGKERLMKTVIMKKYRSMNPLNMKLHQ
jgi:hypothetical protein